MANVHPIHVRAEIRGTRGANLDIARRLLRDIRQALEHLAEDGRSSAIDLRQLPHMTGETYEWLREQLGTGEVSAVILAGMKVEVAETGFPGVWWLTHCQAGGEIITEIIEITRVPALLQSSPSDVRAGLERLNRQLSIPAPGTAESAGGAQFFQNITAASRRDSQP